MGQAKQRGTYEQRAASPQGYVRGSGSLGQWLRSRSRFFHISQKYTYDLVSKQWKAVFVNQAGAPHGVSFSKAIDDPVDAAHGVAL